MIGSRVQATERIATSTTLGSACIDTKANNSNAVIPTAVYAVQHVQAGSPRWYNGDTGPRTCAHKRVTQSAAQTVAHRVARQCILQLCYESTDCALSCVSRLSAFLRHALAFFAASCFAASTCGIHKDVCHECNGNLPCTHTAGTGVQC